MRRKERLVSDEHEIEKIIRDCSHVILGLQASGAPYLVPLNFGYAPGKIYLHSALQGRKAEILRAAGGSVQASLAFVSKAEILEKGTTACDLSTRYASVLAEGRLEEVTDPDEKLRGLASILEQTGIQNRAFPEGAAKAVMVLCFTINEISGKKNVPERDDSAICPDPEQENG